MEVKELVQWVIPFLVAWNTWSTKSLIEMKSKLDVNTALDEQYKITLAEIKIDIHNMQEDIKKILIHIGNKDHGVD